MEGLNVIEADRIVKRQFWEAIGEGFDKNQMVFFAKRSKLNRSESKENNVILPRAMNWNYVDPGQRTVHRV
jgi:hypothetical protein